MSGLIAIDHHVAPVELRAGQRVNETATIEWSARRRLSFLAACVVFSWMAVLVPVFLLF